MDTMTRLGVGTSIVVALLAPCAAQGAQGAPGRCKVRPDSDWSATEAWVWARVCAGTKASLLDRPRVAREIHGAFISRLLMDARFRDSIPASGVQIDGATIIDDVHLAGAELRFPIWIENSQIDGAVDMRNVHALSTLSFNNSLLTRDLYLYGAKVDGDLELNGGEYANVSLARIEIGGQLNVVDSEVRGTLNVYDSRIAHSMFLSRSRFSGAVRADNAVFGGSLIVLGATLPGLSLTHSRVSGVFEIGCQVAADPVRAVMQLSGNLHSHPWRRILTSEAATTWTGDAPLLNLQGADVRLLSATDDAWPGIIDLRGFKYAGFVDDAEYGSTPCEERRRTEAAWSKRPPADLISLLGRRRGNTFSLQPYVQLAGVLQGEGYADSAREVLYAGREVERTASRFPVSAWLWLERVVTGYGQMPERALACALGFILAGALVFRSSRQAKALRMPYGLAFSFDMLLPVVKLREAHYGIDMQGWRRYYFYAHKLAGWVLLGFIVSAVTSSLSH